MSKSRLCLLHSVDDAEDYLAGPWRDEGWVPWSTHCSAADYLNHRGVRCHDVSERITLEDQVQVKQAQLPGGALLAESGRLWDALEASVPGDWWEELGLRHPLPLFETMFGYLLDHSLFCREVFELALQRIQAEYRPVEVALYHQAVPAPGFTTLDVLEQMAATHGFQLKLLHSAGRLATAPLSVRPIRPRFVTYARAARKRLRMLGDWFKPASAQPGARPKGTLLLYPECSLRSLAASALPFNLLLWPAAGLPPAPGVAVPELMARAGGVCVRIVAGLEASSPAPGFPSGFWSRFTQDFAQHGAPRLASLALLEALLRAGRVDAAAWSFSAGADPTKALMMRYCLLCGVPVAGLQHGGNYGVQDCGNDHVRADYAFCTRFYTFGAASSDLEASLLERIPCRIVPLKKSAERFPETSGLRQGGPVVFPITNCYGLLETARVSPAFLASAQELVLSALDDRTDLDVWVKPFHGAAPANLSCPDRLRNLRHAKVGGGNFSWFLSQRRPRLVVIEYPSEPLFESLSHDVDIFLLLDPLFPFTPEAERMLRERAHVFDTAEEMAQAIRDYGQVPLPRLRSMEFVTRFLDRRNVEPRLAAAFVEWSTTWSRAT